MRKHDVEDDGVVVGSLGFEESVVAIGGGVHGVAFLTQRFGEVVLQPGFIFDNEDSHDSNAGSFCHPKD